MPWPETVAQRTGREVDRIGHLDDRIVLSVPSERVIVWERAGDEA
jgi:hypothetical protein